MRKEPEHTNRTGVSRAPAGYGQYCPLALSAELLCQRWTILVLSRVIDGCHRFNEIRRGVPQISPTLLSQRLEQLEAAGLIRSTPLEGRRGRDYQLTNAGADAEGLIVEMAGWGQRWARDMVSEDLDPAFLVWSMHTRLATDRMPEGRTVLEFAFTGSPTDCDRFWLIHEDGQVEMCLQDPGLSSDVLLESDLRRFVEAWRGFRDMKQEIQAGHIRLYGERSHRLALPEWLLGSTLWRQPRMRKGAERRAYLRRRRTPAERDA